MAGPPKYFKFRPIPYNLLKGRRGVKEWKCILPITAWVPEWRAVLSLGEEYLLSVGAHATHGALFMDPGIGRPLTIESALHWCGILSYTFDAPFVLDISRNAASNFLPPDISNYRRFRGGPLADFEEYLQALTSSADAAVATYAQPQRPKKNLFRNEYRCLPHQDDESCPLISLPTQKSLMRAIMAYWTGLISIPVGSRFLNFWRAGEAAAPQREHGSVFISMAEQTPWAVWARQETYGMGPENKESTVRYVNLTRSLRESALRRYQMLLKKYRTPEGAWKVLREHLRGKVAHADNVSIEYDYLKLLAEQARDSELMRYVARAAIDSLWAKEPAIDPPLRLQAA